MPKVCWTGSPTGATIKPHPVYDTVKGAAVGTYLPVGTAAVPAYFGVGVLQRSRQIQRPAHHAHQFAAPGTSPPLPQAPDHQHVNSIAAPVPVRPIGRTGTEITAIQNNQKSKPRSQSQKRAVPDDRSQHAAAIEFGGFITLLLTSNSENFNETWLNYLLVSELLAGLPVLALLLDSKKNGCAGYGDILVSTKSATARSKNTAEFNFAADNHFELAKTYHFQLQASEKVYEQIKTWMRNI